MSNVGDAVVEEQVISCPSLPAWPGGARPWEAEIPVSTYASVNALHRNLITRVPLFEFDGTGPDISVTLYHNSATPDLGWRASYSRHLKCRGWPNADCRLSPWLDHVRDDGTVERYVREGYVPPQWSPPERRWLGPDGQTISQKARGVAQGYLWLRFRDQSVEEYDATGRLRRVLDANGAADGAYAENRNATALTVLRPAAGVMKIRDSVGREVWFSSLAGRLMTIWDAAVPTQPFRYDLTYGTGGAVTITDPAGRRIEATHDAAGRILQMSDRRLASGVRHITTFEYEGEGNAVKRVIDPEGQDARLGAVQEFATSCEGAVARTEYRDRRGGTWAYEWPLPTASDPRPVLSATTNPVGDRTLFFYDAGKHLLRRQDALGKSWTYTYDDRGNRLTRTDPLGITETWTYDAKNNETSYTDGEGSRWDTFYELADGVFPSEVIPTSPTRIEGPANADGVRPTIRFEYVHTAGFIGSGQLKRVTDANGVVTALEYDPYGQISLYAEGVRSSDGEESHVFEMRSSHDPWSREQTSWWGCGATNVATTELGGGAGNASHPSGGAGGGSPETGGCGLARAIASADGEDLPPDFPAQPSNLIAMPDLPTWSWAASYTAMGAPASHRKTASYTWSDHPVENSVRTYETAYDELNAQTLSSHDMVNTDDPNPGSPPLNNYDEVIPARTFEKEYDRAAGITRRRNPDGSETVTYTDLAGRVERVERGGLSAEYSYTPTGEIATIEYGNGTSVVYGYDDAGRTTSVHFSGGSTYMFLQYTYNRRGQPVRIEESRPTEHGTAIVTMAYDAEGRLISEKRERGFSSFDLEYRYDLGGNRTRKIDKRNWRETEYIFDIQDPTFGTANNRLMRADVYRTSTMPHTLLTQTYYAYNCSGNVTHITTPGPVTKQTRLHYLNGNVMNAIFTEEWAWGGFNYKLTAAREFRYDSGRERYLNRKLSPEALRVGRYQTRSDEWSDYDGHEIAGSYGTEYMGTVVRERDQYTPGLFEEVSLSPPEYLYLDPIGTTRLARSDTGSVTRDKAYTGFGDSPSGGVPFEIMSRHRFGYAGKWGYQSDAISTGYDEDRTAITPFLHVGVRYYDPGSGRFLQRDPIGVEGGTNVYAYVDNSPLDAIDPDGLTRHNLRGRDGRFRRSRGIRGIPEGAPWARGAWVLWQCAFAAKAGWALGKLIVDKTDIEDRLGEVLQPVFFPTPPIPILENRDRDRTGPVEPWQPG